MSLLRSRTEPSVSRPDWLSVSLVLGAALLCYYLVPLLSLLVARPPAEIIAQLTDPTVLAAARTSLLGSLLSTAIATVFGVPLAYWLARTDGRPRTLVTVLVVFPLVLPPVVSGMLLLALVGPETPIGRLAASYGLSLTRSLAGVVLAQIFVASPFVVVTATAAFESVDAQLEAAARSLGCSRLTTLRRVTIPLAWPGILAGVTLGFARAMGEFGATLMLAYYPQTLPVRIWVAFVSLGLDAAFPVAVVLVAIALVTLLVLNALGRYPFR
jgi:molybdate/tungstate transport system permease protein